MGTLACAVALLTACGGQSSATSNTNSPGTQTTGSQSSTLAGGYQGTVPYSGYNSEFVSFATPSLDWYALYYLQTTTASIFPIIFKGRLDNVTSNSAAISSPGLTVFQFDLPKLSSGGAGITNASAQAYKLDLNGITLPIPNDLSVQATKMTTYTMSTGVWAGTLTDNLSSASTNLTLTFDSGGSGTFTGSSSYANCPLALTLTPESQTSNPYFSAALSIAANTGCARTPASTAITMSGIGFIHAPSAGTKRLELILTDASGSGLSFRGDQSQ